MKGDTIVLLVEESVKDGVFELRLIGRVLALLRLGDGLTFDAGILFVEEVRRMMLFFLLSLISTVRSSIPST